MRIAGKSCTGLSREYGSSARDGIGRGKMETRGIVAK